MVKRIGIFIGVLVLAMAIGGFFYLRMSLPQIDGEIRLAGLSAPVTVIRDKNAVPHISAETEDDLYFALGFVHAQDRLWQMEMNRRIAQGRMAEVLGAEALGADKFIRTLSLFARAKAALDLLDDRTLAMLEAYAAGVNAFLTNNESVLPPEFIILGFEPEPWRPEDTLGWFKMMAWDLGGNWRWEIGRLRLLARLAPEQIMEFYPPYRGDETIPLPDPVRLYDGAKLNGKSAALQYLDEGPEGLGSNNWVIDGSRTESGKPLLANDPHLAFSAPSIWYLAHLQVNGKNMVGVTFPGAPNVVLGRNDFAAWGFTNTGPDVQDLYMERITGDGSTYATPDGDAPFVTRTETIPVKDAEPVTITVRDTRHGPVISDVMAGMEDVLPEGYVLAFRWTALDPDDSTTVITRRLIDVETWDEMPELLKDFIVPQQNIVFADTTGNIGYLAPGRIPIRGTDNDAAGLLPAPGWDARYDWQGSIPFDELPRIENPEKGYIATANSKIVDDDYPYFLSSNWALPYRTWRISEMIEATDKHTIDSIAAIQRDTFSTMADEFLPLMLPAVKNTHPEIYATLTRWDRRMERDRPEPLIYIAWHRNLAWAIYGDELGEENRSFWRLRAEFLRNILSDRDGQSRWCDDIGTKSITETCDEVIRAALYLTMAELSKGRNNDWNRWRWDEVHRARHAHRPFSGIPVLGILFDGVIPVPGGPYTVNVTNVTLNSNTPFESRHGASYRAIYDLSDLDNSRYIIPMGQSGNPLSSNYRDFSEPWRDGRSITIPTDMAKAAEGAMGTLRLMPGS